MIQIIAGLLSDRYPPEKVKFRSPLVLVHGLWSGSSCWRLWANHFSNLGWDCSAINFRGRFGDSPGDDLRRLAVQDCVRDLTAVIGSFSFPPLVAAMNLGALIALKAAEQCPLSALILISPALPRNLQTTRSRARRLLRLKYSPLIFLRRPIRIDAKDFSESFLYPLPAGKHYDIYKQTVPESPLLVREFLLPRSDLSSKPRFPILVLAGVEDVIQPVENSRELARWLMGDCKEYAGQGHWLIEQDSQSVVRDIHRWAIQQLSEQILLAEAP
jgi:pimeloyl-ACP methyl ester carboxylesterase